MVSEAEDSLFVVLSSHRAEQLLTEVFERGSPAAKAYALCGLHYVAPKRFEHYAGRFESEPVMVRTLSGCIVSQHSSAEIVAAIRTNIFEGYLPHRILIESNRARLNIRR